MPTGSQLAEGNGVEGAGGRKVAQPQPTEPPAQLGRSLAGEGDAQGPAWVEVVDGRPVGDPSGEDAGLARPGSGADHQWLGGGGDRVQLLGVEAGEQLHGYHVAESTDRTRARLVQRVGARGGATGGFPGWGPARAPLR